MYREFREQWKLSGESEDQTNRRVSQEIPESATSSVLGLLSYPRLWRVVFLSPFTYSGSTTSLYDDDDDDDVDDDNVNIICNTKAGPVHSLATCSHLVYAILYTLKLTILYVY